MKKFTSTLIFILVLIAISSAFYSFYSFYNPTLEYTEINNTDKKAVLIETGERFHPLFFKHGAVASQEKLASQVGVNILKKGGNAIDAAVAVGYALAVTLPQAGNIGGGGFLLYWDNKNKKAYLINYRETAPLKASRDMFINPETKEVNDELLKNSNLAAAVPGTVAGLNMALEKFGTMPLSDVITPAIDLAQNGFPINMNLEFTLSEQKQRFAQFNATKKIFFKDDENTYKLGDLFIQKDLAETLTEIKNHGNAGFYQGKVAKLLLESSDKYHGIITQEDLDKYTPEITNPIMGTYRDYKIISAPPPSSGGVTIIELLNILENFKFNKSELNSAKNLHLLIEAMNLAYNDRNKYLGDPNFIKMPLATLLSKTHAKNLAKKINQDMHLDPNQISKQILISNEGENTTHFAVIDKDGSIVANTYTLNFSYGNAIVVDGAGFLMNNEMADFAVKPGSKNYFGLVEGENNKIEPNKRPLSSMAPTIILNNNNEPYFSTGTPGGSRIITTILQNIINMIDFDLNLASSVAYPKIHSQLWPDYVLYEDGISPDTLALLEKKGHKVKQGAAFGSSQNVGIAANSEYFMAYSDVRRQDALAAGF